MTGSGTIDGIVTRDTRRIAVVGTGHRAGGFIQALATTFRNEAAIVGLCDSNPVRLEHYRSALSGEWQYPRAVRMFAADSFEQMIRQTRPDTVLICTPDFLHADYVCRALEAGCDAIVEKPLAIDAAGCNRIIETSRRTGRDVRVAFNCRYLPTAGQVKRLLTQGVIGEVISGSLEYMIGAEHGATYFARWHSQKDRSGGLLVHKSSHHFDLMNWWIDAVPQSVFATGRRGFFGADNQHKHGIASDVNYYLDGGASDDPFQRVFANSETYREMYLRGAEHDGYRGDRSVWRDEDMDIEDAMAVNVRYRSGQIFTYTLNAFCPIAGFNVSFNGTKGRLELRTVIDAHVNATKTAHQALPDAEAISLDDSCVVYPLYGQPYSVPIPTAEGSHEGSDPLMMKQLFAHCSKPDDFGQRAGAEQGAASALVGIAANQSIAANRPVAIDELTGVFDGRVRLSELA